MSICLVTEILIRCKECGSELTAQIGEDKPHLRGPMMPCVTVEPCEICLLDARADELSKASDRIKAIPPVIAELIQDL